MPPPHPCDVVARALRLSFSAHSELDARSLATFLDAAAEVKRCNLRRLSERDRLTFFLNAYHLMVSHAPPLRRHMLPGYHPIHLPYRSATPTSTPHTLPGYHPLILPHRSTTPTSCSARPTRYLVITPALTLQVNHAYLVLGPPSSSRAWLSYFNTIAYEAGGDIFSLSELEHCIIRANRWQPPTRTLNPNP